MQNALRGHVFSQYENLTVFSDKLGWDRGKTSRIVNGKQRPSADEMEQIASALNVHDVNTFMDLFFPKMSTKLTS